MRFLIPLVGRTRSPWLEAGIRDYAERLGRYVRLDMPVLKDRHIRGAPAERTLALQAETLAAACSGVSFWAALDLRGQGMSSEDLARLLGRWEDRGMSEAAFLVGGHPGLHESILQRADLRLSLSPMTFTHEMARLLLVEQLYRACAIRAGHPYHL